MVAADIRIYTIGHSNRSLEDFLALLKEFDIQALADIRSQPGSRKFPHFNLENLETRPSRTWREVLLAAEARGPAEDPQRVRFPEHGPNQPGFSQLRRLHG